MTSALPPFELTPALEQALLKKFEAETAKAAAEAFKEEQYAIAQKVQTDALVRAEQDDLTHDRFYHHYSFNGAVLGLTVDRCLRELALWDRQDKACDMNLTIDSPGGSVIDGMHLFDQLANYSLRGGGGHKVTITVRGYAASMAGILLQAADVRRIGAESYLMIHEISTFAQGKIGELKDEMKFLDRISARVADIFVTRAAGKITLEDFQKGWHRADWWLDSKQAVELGFADEIG